ncbi:FAD:protein FMN transferase [Fusobacterium massiliense]|uniref:FAD:protein FMN transferase n=1 Tax=Fusobacterium massiliense TaxID=1852365 RepID=UPI0028E216A2|nr:FAD:protein FMN transferase [Fusobacterium massiliense]
MKKSKLLSFLFVILFLFVSCGKEKIEKYEDSQFLFGTYIKIIVYDSNKELAENSIKKAFEEIQRIDLKFNSKSEGSLIYNLNSSNEKSLILDEEGQEIFSKIREAYEISGHKYDITIAPLLELWGFTEEGMEQAQLKLPTKEKIEYIKRYVDFGKVKFENNKMSFESPVKEIDTGSFLKGYAIEKAKNLLKKEGIKSAFVTAISSLDSIGGKPQGKPWKIGLQNPEDPSQIIGIVDLKDKAMGISGDYQTYVEIDGKMYHHILDKETGYPVKDKKMVAVICDNAFDADVYSTTFFLMPIDKVLEYVDNKDGIEVLIVDKDMKIIKSKNFNFQEVKK